MSKKRPLVIALGGNALKAGANILDYPSLPLACQTMTDYTDGGLVVTHGNGPQIGTLAARNDTANWPLDVLGAETEGLLGYVLEHELGNQMDDEYRLVTLLTRTEVVKDDKDFNKPVKPVGPWVSQDEARELEQEHGWTFKEENGRYRRLVPSPRPRRTLQLEAIRCLIDDGYTVICAGGGGIPVIRDHKGNLNGLDAVIDKDLTSALLAAELDARMLVLATDVKGVFRDFHGNEGDIISRISPEAAAELALPAGSMGPKVRAASEFVKDTGAPAVIGALNDLRDLIDGKAGTLIHHEAGREEEA